MLRQGDCFIDKWKKFFISYTSVPSNKTGNCVNCSKFIQLDVFLIIILSRMLLLCTGTWLTRPKQENYLIMHLWLNNNKNIHNQFCVPGCVTTLKKYNWCFPDICSIQLFVTNELWNIRTLRYNWKKMHWDSLCMRSNNENNELNCYLQFQ